MASFLNLTYVGHSTVLLEIDGVRLLTDPVLRNRVGFLRRHANGFVPGRYRRVDAVLLSHFHLDHLDPRSLQMLDSGTLIVAPHGAASYLRQRGFANVVGMADGDTVAIGRVTVQATPANHGRSRYPWGPAAEPLGYVVSGGHRLYFAGDTGHFSEMRQLAGNLDIALLPVWGWGYRLGKHHLDPRGAAEAAAILRPRLAVPVHWGTLRPIGIGWLNPGYLKEPPAAFARHAARLAPEVSVQIVPPGGSMRYDKDGTTALNSGSVNGRGPSRHPYTVG